MQHYWLKEIWVYKLCTFTTFVSIALKEQSIAEKYFADMQMERQLKPDWIVHKCGVKTWTAVKRVS
jgi:hypothetical protein